MGTQSKKSNFSSAVLAINFVKAFERAGMTPQQMHDVAKKGNEEFCWQCLHLHRGTLKTVLVDPTMFDPMTLIGRKNLYLTKSFKKNVLFVAEKTIRFALGETPYFVFNEKTTFNKIREDLGESSYFTATEFCFWFDEQINLPRSVKNEFYPSDKNCFVLGLNGKVFVVHHEWNPVEGWWYVDADEPSDEEFQRFGCCVFSRNSILTK
ncbi:hypothetical protein ACFL05_00350 [Patescibacteria group bacterium]